jgi:hypothetical protein
VEQMVARDLVLRAQVDDAELLVFPSSQLPERFQCRRPALIPVSVMSPI